MDYQKVPKCPVCGKPATQMARDSVRDLVTEQQKMDGYAYWTPGEARFGCDDHPPRKPREIGL